MTGEQFDHVRFIIDDQNGGAHGRSVIGTANRSAG
jgi:hypothetical protein